MPRCSVCIFALALALRSPVASSYRDDDWKDGALTVPNDKAPEKGGAEAKDPDSEDEAAGEGGAEAKDPPDSKDEAAEKGGAEAKDPPDSKDKATEAKEPPDSKDKDEAAEKGGAEAKEPPDSKDKATEAEGSAGKQDKAESVFRPALKSSDDLNDAAQGIETASVEAKTKAEKLSDQFKTYQEQLGSTRDLLNDMSSEVRLFKAEVTDYFANSESDKYSPIAVEAQVDEKEKEAITAEIERVKEEAQEEKTNETANNQEEAQRHQTNETAND